MADSECAKGSLYFFNVLLWLSGAALLGLGVWLLVDQSTLSRVIAFVTAIDGLDFETDSLDIVAYVFIAVGCVIFIVGFIGCVGGAKEVKCLLGFYIFFLILVFLAEIGAGAIAFVYRDEVLDRVRTEGSKYVMTEYTNSKEADYGLNFIQYNWECCGVVSARDYINSNYSRLDMNLVSPFCCRQTAEYSFSERLPDPLNGVVCQNEAQACLNSPSLDCAGFTRTQLYFRGCVDEILDWVRDNLPIFIAVGIGLAGLELILIGVSIHTCRFIGK